VPSTWLRQLVWRVLISPRPAPVPTIIDRASLERPAIFGTSLASMKSPKMPGMTISRSGVPSPAPVSSFQKFGISTLKMV